MKSSSIRSIQIRLIIIGIILLLPIFSCAPKLKQSDIHPLSFTFLGNASVKIKTASGYVIYIDPARGESALYSDPADLVLITHTHSDHNNPALVKIKDNKPIIAPVMGHNLRYIMPDEKINIDGIEILRVAAYNKNHDKNASCGYVLSFNGYKIYHCGDTSKTEEMPALAAMNIDLALLCMDGQFNMNALEAKECAAIIKAKKYIPIHTMNADISTFDIPEKIVLNPGESLEL